MFYAIKLYESLEEHVIFGTVILNRTIVRCTYLYNIRHKIIFRRFIYYKRTHDTHTHVKLHVTVIFQFFPF